MKSKLGNPGSSGKEPQKAGLSKKMKALIGCCVSLAVIAPTATALGIILYDKQKQKKKVEDEAEQHQVTKSHFDEFYQQALNTVYSESLLGSGTAEQGMTNALHLYNAVEDKKHEVLDEMYKNNESMEQAFYYEKLYSQVQQTVSAAGINVFDEYQWNATAFGSSEEKETGLLTSEAANINDEEEAQFVAAYQTFGDLRKFHVMSDAEALDNTAEATGMLKKLNKSQRAKYDVEQQKSIANWVLQRIQNPEFFVASASSNLNLNTFWMTNTNRLQEGSILSTDQIGDFFEYSYDTSVGAKQKIKSVDQKQLENMRGDKSTDISDTSNFNAPLCRFTGTSKDDNYTYLKGEVYPNQKLVAKIKTVDMMSDSHKVKVTFDLGMCPTTYFDLNNINNLNEHTTWFADLIKEDGEDQNVDVNNLIEMTQPTVEVNLTEQETKNLSQELYYKNQGVAINGTTNEPFAVDSADDTNKIITIKEKQGQNHFSNFENLLPFLPIGQEVGTQFNVNWRKDETDEGQDGSVSTNINYDGGDSSSNFDMLPRFTPSLNSHIDSQNNLFGNQQILVKITQYNFSGQLENGADFAIEYRVMDDGQEKSYDPLGKVLPIFYNNKTYDQIKFHLKPSASMIAKIGAVKSILTEYKSVKARYPFLGNDGEKAKLIELFEKPTDENLLKNYSEQEKLFVQQGQLMKLYPQLRDCRVTSYVFNVVIPVISGALVVAYTILTATTLGGMAWKLVIAVIGLTTSIINCVYDGLAVTRLKDLEKPLVNNKVTGYDGNFTIPEEMFDALNTIVKLGDENDWDWDYERLVNFPEKTPAQEQLNIVNSIETQTNKFKTLGSLYAKLDEVTKKWLDDNKDNNGLKKTINYIVGNIGAVADKDEELEVSLYDNANNVYNIEHNAINDNYDWTKIASELNDQEEVDSLKTLLYNKYEDYYLSYLDTVHQITGDIWSSLGSVFQSKDGKNMNADQIAMEAWNMLSGLGESAKEYRGNIEKAEKFEKVAIAVRAAPVPNYDAQHIDQTNRFFEQFCRIHGDVPMLAHVHGLTDMERWAKIMDVSKVMVEILAALVIIKVGVKYVVQGAIAGWTKDVVKV